MTQITAELVRQLANPRAHISVWEARESAVIEFLATHPRATKGAFTAHNTGSAAWFLPVIIGLVERDVITYERDYAARGGDAIRFSLDIAVPLPFIEEIIIPADDSASGPSWEEG